MSQQNGLLTEEEIRNYLNQAFGLKIDRDTLLRPTKEFALDIYARFLDTTGYKWRDSNNDDPSMQRSIMINKIRFMISHYNISITFCETDLIAPNRKRTTTFLNVLIFIHAQFDERYAEWQQSKEEWKARQEQVSEIKKAISDKKLELERRAIEKANLGDPDQMALLIEEKRSEFNVQEQINKRLEADKNRIKASYNAQLEIKEKLKAEKEARRERIEELKRTRQLLQDGRKVQREITELEQMVQREAERLKNYKEKRDQAERKSTKLEMERARQQSANNDLKNELEITRRMFSKTVDDQNALYARKATSEDKLVELQSEIVNISRRIENKEEVRIKDLTQFRLKEQKLRHELGQLRLQARESEAETTLKIQELDQEIEAIQKEIASVKTSRNSKSVELNEKLEYFIKVRERVAEKIAHSVDTYRKLLSDPSYVCPFEQILGFNETVDQDQNCTSRMDITYMESINSTSCPINESCGDVPNGNRTYIKK